MTISIDFSRWTRHEYSFLTFGHRAHLGYQYFQQGINILSRCRETTLEGSYFEESEVIATLKSWKIGSSIQYLRLEFVRAGSNEDFKAKMLEINADPVPEAVNGNPNL
ncbi:hypothetical protein L5515_016675 [Caenorhabditis briggsae]|uniref:Uncharacterized protein n=1 Tax=Caenorhabditis briggsae TaxID=6238 RepID=A0AAE9FC92_CAEBR|nr:hypothetical protein L5515_016675 [Caenorhabditis briggsae]